VLILFREFEYHLFQVDFHFDVDRQIKGRYRFFRTKRFVCPERFVYYDWISILDFYSDLENSAKFMNSRSI
jgi:hypothetical protein